ncbi:MAG TPA: MaoC family dehydratase [Saliniramus sp.]|nr:MaoC family dehydratase [Saliniramus sp.]
MTPRYFFEDFAPGSTMSYGGIVVEKDDIVAFAREFDPQSFHTDEEAARATFVGSLIASGWHTCALQMRMIAEGFILEASSMGAPGIDSVRWVRPVRPGDRLSARHTVLEARRSSKRPEMGLVLFRFETLNQDGEVVLEQKNWIMFALREGYRQASAAPLSRPVRQPAPFSMPEPARPAPFFENLVIGERVDLGGYTFTEENIVHFAKAFDPQPFHTDPDAAARTHFGGLCASGWQTGAAWMKQMVAYRDRCRAAAKAADLPTAELGSSPGFTDLKWRKPVYVGDTINYASTVVDKRETRSRPDWGLVFHHNTGTNQDGEVVFEFKGCVFWQREPG